MRTSKSKRYKRRVPLTLKELSIVYPYLIILHIFVVSIKFIFFTIVIVITFIQVLKLIYQFLSIFF
jgi:hypothetical protein